MHYIGEFLAWPNNSGVIGGQLGLLAILGTLFHHLNCHEKGCWRMVRHHKLYCRKHDSDRRADPGT